MNKKDKFKMAAKSALISAIVVPAMGVVAHFMPGKGTFFMDDASLAHRFECAYKWNPNPDHRTYVSYDYKEPGTYSYHQDIDGGIRKYADIDGVYDNTWVEEGHAYDKVCAEETYVAHPMMTGVLYLGVAGMAYAGMRRRKKEAIVASTQKSR